MGTFRGAGDRTRTGTPSLAVDFESTTSTISSHRQLYLQIITPKPSSEIGGQWWRAIQKSLHIHFKKVLALQGKFQTPQDLANLILSPLRLPFHHTGVVPI